MAPLLAANYSSKLMRPLKDEPDIVDAVKVSEFYDEGYVSAYRNMPVRKPFVLHGVCQDSPLGRWPSLGSLEFRESIHMPSLRTAIDLCRPGYISAHLEHYAVDHPSPDELLASLKQGAEFIREITGLPLHLENSYFYFSQVGSVENAPYICDPGFIREALDATEARLLLDVAHAQVAAWHLGIPAEDYIRSLPLALVDEIHVSSPVVVDGELRTRHAEMTKASYALLELVLRHVEVKAISLEYGGVGPVFDAQTDIDALKRQLVRLRTILSR